MNIELEGFSYQDEEIFTVTGEREIHVISIPMKFFVKVTDISSISQSPGPDIDMKDIKKLRYARIYCRNGKEFDINMPYPILRDLLKKIMKEQFLEQIIEMSG